MAERIVLLGTGGSQSHAPYQDRDAEFWAPAWCHNRMSRVTRLFEVHATSRWEKFAAALKIRTEIRAWNERRVPIVMREVDPRLPLSERFPFEALEERFGGLCRGFSPRYLTSTVAFMFAYALLQDPLPRTIEMWGIHMQHHSEWAAQRPCVEFWAGIALGLGITVRNEPTQSYVFRTRAEYGSELYFDLGGATGVEKRAKAGKVA